MTITRRPSAQRASGRILELLEVHGSASRADLTRLSDLPLTTVADAVGRLLADGLAVERVPAAGTREPGRIGRPPVLVALAREPGSVAVLAVSPTTLRAALVSSDGAVRGERSAGLADQFTGAGLVRLGVDLLDGVLGDLGLDRSAVSCAVVGVPAPFKQGFGIVEAGGLPVRDGAPYPPASSAPPWLADDPSVALAERLGRPTFAENDANLAALGEAVHGAGRGLGGVIYVTMNPSIGAGIVLDGRLVRGASGFAGELAHLHVRDDGPLCPCGGRGCLRTVADGGRLAELVQPAYQHELRFRNVIELARAGETGVHRILNDHGRLVGGFLATACMLLNPDAIILDARMGASGPPILAGIREMIDRDTPRAVSDAVRVVHGALGDRAELVGAAVLAHQEGLRLVAAR